MCRECGPVERRCFRGGKRERLKGGLGDCGVGIGGEGQATLRIEMLWHGCFEAGSETRQVGEGRGGETREPWHWST